MASFLNRWWVDERSAAEARLSRLQDSFASVSRRYQRSRWFRRNRSRILMIGGVLVAATAGLALSPWPAMTTLQHIASFPNCDAARAVGLAPARRGHPGYWPSHDRDNDGIACELWPRR